MNRKYKIILGAVCVALSIFLGYLKIKAAADEEVFTSAEADDPEPQEDTTEIPPEELVVHVCGCVNSPGVYRLKPGSRIIEAVEKAGGFTDEADNSVINLADRLTDGMQIYVPAMNPEPDETRTPGQYVRQADNIPGQGTDPYAGSGPNAGTDSGKVNLNTASKDELMTLNGVGASRADAIIAYRTENGPFASTEEIMNISGIKDGLFGKIKDKITVE